MVAKEKKFVSYGQLTKDRSETFARGTWGAPEKVVASDERRAELRSYLQQIARRVYGEKTLNGLVTKLGYHPNRASHWIYWGELPPWTAAFLSKTYELWRRAQKKKGLNAYNEITLRDLTPSLFLPE